MTAAGSTVDLPARIIRRADWQAQPPARPAQLDALPYERLWLHHTAGVPGGAVAMREAQRDHLARGWRDLAYNLGVSTAGEVFDGLGVGRRHLNMDAGWSATVVALGNFEDEPPSGDLLEALAWVAAHGHLAGWWRPRGFTGGHRDQAATACPGRYLHAALPTINARAGQIIDTITGAPPPQEDEHMARWIVRAPNGSVYLFDGATLRAANDATYRALLRFHGAACPDPTRDTWFEWTAEQIKAVPVVTPGRR